MKSQFTATILEQAVSHTLAFTPSSEQTGIPVQVLLGSILQVGSGLATALTFPPWVAEALTLTGFCILGIGLMARYGGFSYKSRQWGQRMTFFGVFMIVAGFGFNAIINLLTYVLSP
ncbi:hypothetical protein GJ629_00185 [Halapricum sp. CBA1109]|uniref:hypothetical protein n=1 Tax=Halapricum sp. CBA1109 TaxID=2668068 RepID=UPI0012F95E34|nr:hypothetical protein [Halapricum sp. CBA1109]MUV88494.1 hypothetical protein [Halapricum sp. CBA1109]